MSATTKTVLPRLAAVETGVPFIDVLVSQLDELKRQLDQHGIQYRVNPLFLSFNGGPETTLVHLTRSADIDVIRKILDSLR